VNFELSTTFILYLVSLFETHPLDIPMFKVCIREGRRKSKVKEFKEKKKEYPSRQTTLKRDL